MGNALMIHPDRGHGTRHGWYSHIKYRNSLYELRPLNAPEAYGRGYDAVITF